MNLISLLIALTAVIESTPTPKKSFMGSLARGAAMGGGMAIGNAAVNHALGSSDRRSSETTVIYGQPAYAQPVAQQPTTVIVQQKAEDCYWLFPHGNERRWCLGH